MRSLAILGGGLMLAVSACGGEAARKPANRAFLVRDLDVTADYGQIDLYDPETQVADSTATEDDNPLLRALDDGSDSRRFVGYDRGLIVVLTPSQYNWNAAMRIEVSTEAPPLDADVWDHVVEVPLPAPSGTLIFEAPGSKQIEAQIPAGTYRARFSGRGYVAGVGEIEGHESYRLQLWPAPESKPELLKYWDGYDVMRPTE